MDSNGDPILTPEAIITKIQALTTATQLCVAYSGGIDSHVLLDLMVRAFSKQNTYELSALHVHHGISKHADDWTTHCQTICADLHVPLTVLKVDGRVINGRSPEEVAREARFSAFKKHLRLGECLLLAHHASDQAETILFRLLRGCGPLGLAGMSERLILDKSELLRPLLAFPKEAVVAYANAQQLRWIEDDSNDNNRFDRNYLRNAITPLLKARWPKFERSINRAGALCLETAHVAQTQAEQDIGQVKGKEPDTLSVAGLLQLDRIRRKGVIRHWLYSLGLALPSLDHMERIDREVLCAKPGAKPRLKISQYEIRRLKGELSVLVLNPSSAEGS